VLPVEAPAHGRDPGGSGESHFLEVRAGGAALGAPEAPHGLAAGLVMLSDQAA